MTRYAFLAILILFFSSVNAQSLDSLHMEVGVKLQGASSRFQPLWLKANQFGMSSNEQFDQITWIEASNKQNIGDMRFLTAYPQPLVLSYGAAAFNTRHYSRTVIQKAYAQLKHGKLVIRGGRHADLWDDLDPELSVGSLGTSGNALPVPKITAGIDDYVSIPFTNNRIQFKGTISHGWLGSNRFVESFLHEKTFYGRLDLGKWKLYGGVQHYTEWGGRRPTDSLYLDRSFKGFLDVLFVRESNDGSLPLEEEQSGTRPNKAGDQRGLLELGAYFENDQIKLHAYNQTPFESGTGIDIRNIDRLLGLHIKFKDENSLLKDLLVEFIYTKQMEEYGKELQSYYNNGALKTGWEYENNVIGMPIFTNRQEASNYLPIQPYDWRGRNATKGNTNIVNNRIIGGNIASKWEFLNGWGVRVKVTPVVNFGARNFQQYYGNGKGLFQCYSLLEGSYQRGNWTYSLAIAGDSGRLYHNIGTSLGLKYSLRSHGWY